MNHDKLTAEQERIVHKAEGPALVLAGPGAGKTKCIVKRVVQLIADGKASHDEILVITFTNKAAHELRTRIDDELRERQAKDPDFKEINLDEMYVSTFHAFCQRMFKEYPQLRGGYSRNARVMDDTEQSFFIQKHIRTMWTENGGKKRLVFKSILGIEDKAYIDSLLSLIGQNYLGRRMPDANNVARAICSSICDKLIDEVVTPGELLNANKPEEKTLGKLLESYLKLLQDNDVHFFSTLQHTLYHVLEKHPDILCDKFKYIIVDEYQDTNRIQNELLRLMTHSHKNLMVVGDDDQSIYRFRGAVVDNILTFENQYPGCEKIILSDNFRSPKEIVDFYSAWMNKPGVNWGNNCRCPKTLKAHKNVPGSVCQIYESDIDKWMDRITDFIADLKSSDRIKDYNQIVFLCDSVKAKHIVRLQEHLLEKGIPVYSPRSGRFLNRGKVLFTIGCLLKVLGFDFSTSGKNYPYFAQAQEYAEKVLENHMPLSDLIDSLSKQLDGIKNYNELLYRMFAYEPFSEWLSKDMDLPYEELLPARNIAQLTRMIAAYEKLQPYISSVEKDKNNFVYNYLKYMVKSAPCEYEDEKDVAPSGYVSFMTIHQSKGLQFPIVIADLPHDIYSQKGNYVTDWINSRIPTREKPEDKPKYDLMRLYYTAFSRAQNLLVLSCLNPDSFFFEATQNAPELKDVADKISAMSFNTVQPADLTDSFAFTSDVEPYEECPRRYKFAKALSFAPTRENTPKTLLGSLIHQTIEDLNRFAMDGGTPDPADFQQLVSDNAVSFGRANNVTFSDNEINEAVRHLTNYYTYIDARYGKTNPENKWHNINAVEKEVSLPMEYNGQRYTMKGAIDLTREYSNYYTIIDIKTGGNSPQKIAGHRRQLRVYSYLLRKIAGQREMNMQLFFTGVNDKPVNAISYKDEFNSGRIKDEINNYHTVVEKIMKKDFSGTARDSRTCDSCDFRFYCGKANQPRINLNPL